MAPEIFQWLPLIFNDFSRQNSIFPGEHKIQWLFKSRVKFHDFSRPVWTMDIAGKWLTDWPRRCGSNFNWWISSSLCRIVVWVSVVKLHSGECYRTLLVRIWLGAVRQQAIGWSPRGLWNPLSKAVPGKCHGSGGHSKCNCLHDRAQLHMSLAQQIVLIFNNE